jgi:hypothetical protein
MAGELVSPDEIELRLEAKECSRPTREGAQVGILFIYL